MAALRHVLRPLKQISSVLGPARAGTPRLAVLSPAAPPLPVPALGLRPRSFSSGTNTAQAKTYTTPLQDVHSLLNNGYGTQYYRHGKMVGVIADRMPGVWDKQTFNRLKLEFSVFLAISGSFAVYKFINHNFFDQPVFHAWSVLFP